MISTGPGRFRAVEQGLRLSVARCRIHQTVNQIKNDRISKTKLSKVNKKLCITDK